MKHIKKFNEEWSPKFNRTLQGAAALATSTNKPHQKKQSIEDYANRSISKEEFMIKVFNENMELGQDVFTIVHDPKFILKPIEKFASVKQSDLSLSIPVILKYYKKEDGTVVPIAAKEAAWIITFTEDGIIKMKSDMADSPDNQIKFVNRASIENFIAMAIQAITSSPEPGTPVESAAKRIENRMSNIADSDMTKEKQDILALIQKIVLDKDMRSFTI